MTRHLAFDLVAYLAAALLAWVTTSRLGDGHRYPVPTRIKGAYVFALTIGAIFGSVLFGTLNLRLAGFGSAYGKSVLGALAGAIVVAEIFKFVAGIRGSTGSVLVPGLSLGLLIGRLGCYSAGMDDFTHGTATDVPWARDFGDGILRHPVQLYESGAMVPAFVVSLALVWRRSAWWIRFGFYAFAAYYACQRFAWEFLKPYPAVGLTLNLFQWLCLGLLGYAVVMFRKEGRTDGHRA